MTFGCGSAALCSDKSAGCLARAPLGQGRPHLLAIFGTNNRMSLLGAYRLRKMPELRRSRNPVF